MCRPLGGSRLCLSLQPPDFSAGTAQRLGLCLLLRAQRVHLLHKHVGESRKGAAQPVQLLGEKVEGLLRLGIEAEPERGVALEGLDGGLELHDLGAQHL